jgi:hypothetical protein
MRAKFSVSAEIANTAGAGVLVVLPAHGVLCTSAKHFADGECDTYLDSGQGAAEIRENYPVPGQSIVLERALLLWIPGDHGSVTGLTSEIQYRFANGSTADGTSFEVQAFLFEAEGIPGYGQPGDGIVEASGHGESAKIGYTVTAEEHWSATKTLAHPDTAVFTELQERSYADVNVKDDEDLHLVQYQLVVASDKGEKDFGRLFQKSIQVTDTLTGFLPTGAPIPEKTEVVDVTGGGAKDVCNLQTNASATSLTLGFDLCDVAEDQFSPNRRILVSYVFDKYAYTKLISGGGPSALTSVTNTAYLTHTPVAGTPGTSSPSSATAVFGWQQLPPTLPTLTVEKMLKASGTTRAYTVDIARQWESDDALELGDDSNAEFTLTQVQSPTDNTLIGTPISKHVKLGQAHSTAAFALQPGTYRLYESKEINNTVTWASHPSSVDTGLLVKVSEPDPATGATSCTLTGPDQNGTTRDFDCSADGVDYQFTNESLSHGVVKLYPKIQSEYLVPEAFESYPATLALNPGNIRGVKGSDEGTGHYTLMEMVANQDFTVAHVTGKDQIDGTALEDRFALTAVAPNTDGHPLKDLSGVQTPYSKTVKASADEMREYTVFFKSNLGGLKFGKVLKNADGTADETAFTIAFKLYKLGNQADDKLLDPANACTQALNSEPSDFELTQAYAAPQVIHQQFPAGNYCVKEVGIRYGGTDITGQNGARYALYTGTALRLKITAGSYSGVVQYAGTDPGLLESIDGATRLVNRSTYGELSLRNFDGTGQALETTFTVKDAATDGSDYSQTFSGSGIDDIYIPAGKYLVTASSPTGGVLAKTIGYTTASVISADYPSQPVEVTLGAGTPADTAGITVTANPGHAPTVSTTAETKQTAVFVWQYLPQRYAEKIRRDLPTVEGKKGAYTNGMGKARFSLYRLESGNYEPVATDLAPDNSTGKIALGSLPAGQYLLVETALPSAAFIEPGYVTELKKCSNLASISATCVTQAGAKTFSVTAADYTDQPTQALSVGQYLNVPKNTISITKTKAGSTTPLAGVEFKLCQGTDCATATTDDKGKLSFADLVPGSYTLTESGAPLGYLPADAKLTISIDADGWPALTWAGDPAPGTTLKPAPGSRASADSTQTQVTTAVGITNVEPPSIGFEKLGLSAQWDNDGRRIAEPLPGAGFTLTANGNYYTIADGNLALLNDDGKPKSGDVPASVVYKEDGTAKCTDYPGLICTDALGQLDIADLDPTLKYTLKELFVPEIVGPHADGLKYLPVTRDFRFYWDTKANSGLGGWITVANHLDPSDTDNNDPWLANVDGRFELLDTTEPHHIRIDKLPVFPVDTSDYTKGFTGDGSWDKPVVRNARFSIYYWVDNFISLSDEQKAKLLVDTVTLGSAALEDNNYALSRELPAGKYLVIEEESPLEYAGLDLWEEPGFTTPGKDGQTTSVYYQCNTSSAKLDKDKTYPILTTPNCVGTTSEGWVPSNLGSDKPQRSAIVEVPVEPGKDAEITFGNSNKLTPTPDVNESRWVAWYGEKAGFLFDALSGEYKLDLPDFRLGGIEFDVFPAYVDSSGKYQALPTTGGKPLLTFKSSDAAISASILRGQFLTDYIDMAAVFGCVPDPGSPCDDWGDMRKIYAEYASNNGKYSYPSEIAVDWAAVDSDLLHLLANSYRSWSVMFVEKAKLVTTGTVADKTCTDTEPCKVSPLPDSYDFDPENPPSFGVTVTNTGEPTVVYYANGNSSDLKEGVKPQPYRLPNYKGTGYLQLAKLGLDAHGTADTADDTTAEVSGAQFEFHLVDPAYVGDLSTVEGRRLALAHSQLISTSRNDISLSPYKGANSGETLKLPAGVYLLTETAAASGFNAFGTFEAKVSKGAYNPDDPGSYSTSTGSFASGEPIGMVIVPTAGAASEATRLTITDIGQPSARIVNTWSGATITDLSYYGTYTITSASTLQVISAGNGDPSGNLNRLADGTYTLRLEPFSNTDFIANPTATSTDILFTVRGGQILTSGADAPAIGTDPMPANRTAALSKEGKGIWWTLELDDDGTEETSDDYTWFTIHVNHTARGQLVVDKRLIDSTGQPSAARDGSWASFSYECVVDKCAGASGTFTWNAADTARGGKRVRLAAGVYKVAETAVSNSGWMLDSTPVYVQIEDEGATYLVRGAGVEAKDPLIPSNTPAVFYNTSDHGVFEVKKFAAASDTENLPGAEFAVYKRVSGESEPSEGALNNPVVTIVDAAASSLRHPARESQDLTTEDVATDAQHDEVGKTLRTPRQTPSKYTAELPAGTYWLAETKAPTGYARRTDYIAIEVLPGQSPVYVGYNDAENKNVAVVLDAGVLNLDVAKETTYSAIGVPGKSGYVPARDARVSLLPMILWKRVSGTSAQRKEFEPVSVGNHPWALTADAALAAETGVEIGTARFPITEPGEYRLVEQVPSTHRYLLVNSAFKVQDAGGNTIDFQLSSDCLAGTTSPSCTDPIPDSALLGTGPSLFVVYNAQANRLEIDTSRANPGFKYDSDGWAALNTDKQQPAGPLTVNNPFSGYVVTVLKEDAATGELVSVPGAEFELYQTKEAALAGGTPGKLDGLEQVRDTDGDGVASFTPRFATGEPFTLWVREEAPPSGYTIDPWFDEAVKSVEIDPSAAGKQYTVIFRDGKDLAPDSELSKVVTSGQPGSASNPVVSSLNTGGLATSYTITPDEPGNDKPIYNYTLSDGSVSGTGVSFLGQSLAGTEIEIPVDPDGTDPVRNPAPGYSLVSVKLDPASSYHSMADLALDYGGGSAHRKPVWASVNGTWVELSTAQEVALPAGTRTLSIKYADDQGGNRVGARFQPGVISLRVSFGRFVPSPTQPEISKIRNTASVSGCGSLDGEACVGGFSSKAVASIELPVAARPTIAVAKECTLDKCTDSGLSEDRKAFYPGDETQYTITTTNVSERSSASDPAVAAAQNAALGFADPVVLDYLPEVLNEESGDWWEATVTRFGSTPVPYVGSVETEKLGPALIWRFPGLVLEPGESLAVTFRARLAEVVWENPANAAYVTSARTPLLTSNRHPTGASFTVPDFASSANAVFEEGWWTSPSVPARGLYWDLLDALPGFDPASFGLFARAEDRGVVVKPSNVVRRNKSLAVGSGPFSSSAVPAKIELTDTVKFRLALQSSDSATTANIRIADVLPTTGDFYSPLSGTVARGTTWDAELLGYWKYVPGSFSVRTVSGAVPASAYRLCSLASASADVYAGWEPLLAGTSCTTSEADLAKDARAFVVDFGEPEPEGTKPGSGWELGRSEILFVEYEMAFDFSAVGAQDVAELEKHLLDANGGERAMNSFKVQFQTTAHSEMSMLFASASNIVGVELPKAEPPVPPTTPETEPPTPPTTTPSTEPPIPTVPGIRPSIPEASVGNPSETNISEPSPSVIVAAPGDELPFTGADIAGAAVPAVTLILLGAALGLRRRR